MFVKIGVMFPFFEDPYYIPTVILAANSYQSPTALKIPPNPAFNRVLADVGYTFNPLFFFSNTITLVSPWKLEEAVYFTLYVDATEVGNAITHLRRTQDTDSPGHTWSYECDLGGSMWAFIGQVPGEFGILIAASDPRIDFLVDTDIKTIILTQVARVLDSPIAQVVSTTFRFETNARVEMSLL